MRSSLGLIAGGAMACIAATVGAAQQHQHASPPAARSSAVKAEQMRDMMSDPVKHAQMMERMTQCHDMMSVMMEHMRHQQPAKPANRPPR